MINYPQIGKIAHLLIVLCAFTMTSCKKEDICLTKTVDTSLIKLDWQEVECPGSFDTPSTGDEFIIHTGSQFLYPAFYPNNPYEFIFYQVVADSGSQIELDHQISKFNLQTGTKTVLLTNTKIVGKPAWNKDGWIAYKNIEDGLIYLYEDNSTPIQFSNIPNGGTRDENLTWLENGNTLLWGGNDANMAPFIRTKGVYDEDVNTLLYGGAAYINQEFTVSNKGLLLARNTSSNYGVCDLSDGVDNWETVSFPLFGSRYGNVNWHVDGQRFYAANRWDENTTGFYEINYNTKEVKRLFEFCEKEGIKEIICSPNGRYLILHKIERTLILHPGGDIIGAYNEISENSSLWLYDLETKKEARLPLE